MALKNFIYLLGVKLADFLIPLLIFPWLAKILGPSQLGIYVVLQSIITIASVFGDYGYITFGTKKVATVFGDKNQLSNILSSIIAFRVTLSLFSGLISVIIINKIYSIGSIDLNLAVFLNILFNSLNLSFFFYGIDKVKNYSFVYTIGRFSMIPLIYLFVDRQEDLNTTLYINLLPLIIISIYSIFVIYGSFKIRFRPPRLSQLYKEATDGWYYFLPNLYSIFFTTFGVIGLKVYLPNAEVGGYAAMERLVKAASGVCGVVNQVVYPRIAAEAGVSRESAVQQLKKYAKIFIPIIAFVSLSMMIFGREISSVLFGDQYDRFTMILKYMPIYILLAGINTFIGVIYMTIFGMQKEYSLSFLYGTIAAMFIYFVLPPYLEIHAPAFGLVLGELIIMISIALFIRKGKYASS